MIGGLDEYYKSIYAYCMAFLISCTQSQSIEQHFMLAELMTVVNDHTCFQATQSLRLKYCSNKTCCIDRNRLT